MKSHAEAPGVALVRCYYGHSPAEGIAVTLMDSRSNALERSLTGDDGVACLAANAPGEYIIRVWSPKKGFMPRAYYCHVLMCPGEILELRLTFSRSKQNVFGRLVVTLRDRNYPQLTLQGGVYQLWQTC